MRLSCRPIHQHSALPVRLTEFSYQPMLAGGFKNATAEACTPRIRAGLRSICQLESLRSVSS